MAKGDLYIGDLIIPKKSKPVTTKAASGVHLPKPFLAKPGDLMRHAERHGKMLPRGGKIVDHNDALPVYVKVDQYRPPTATDEQLEAREYAERCRALDKTPAGRRAREVLFRNLTPEQRKTAERHFFFDIEWRPPPEKYPDFEVRNKLHLVFRIDRTFPNGNIFIWVPDKFDFFWCLCIHPEEPFPLDDIVLTQKTMIEHDLENFITQANVTALFPKEDGKYWHISRERFEGIYSKPEKRTLVFPFTRDSDVRLYEQANNALGTVSRD